VYRWVYRDQIDRGERVGVSTVETRGYGQRVVVSPSWKPSLRR
jgi:hypothetical protein